MVNGFEEQTAELGADEMQIVKILVNRFRQKKGKEHILNNGQICRALETHYNILTTEPRVRKVIQYIRNNNLLIGFIANSNGYYVADNKEEIEAWLNTMIQRRNSIDLTIQKTKKHWGI
jgi:hypothetical protein